MSESLADEVEIRKAARADLDSISRIMNYPPEPPLATMLGVRRASRLGDILVKAGINIRLEDSVVATAGGKTVGVMECGGRSAPGAGTGSYLRILPQILLALGPALPRAAYGFWLRGCVAFEPVPGAFAVVELYVDEGMRNRGIGGRLLNYAEDQARGRWPRMCIETGATNPAQRLYERHGFSVIETKTDAHYERLTGSPGRILMIKEL
jgi:ribosomal protein S18 acetylase RimI-like enzyme